jgi:hypothetical protein
MSNEVFDDMYVEYDLTMEVDRLIGGIPKHPDIVRRWQEAKMPVESKNTEGVTVESATQATIDALGDQALDPDEDAKSVWTGFVQDPATGNIALETRNIKAMLKESANIVRTMQPVLVKGKPIPLRARLAERVFVLNEKGGKRFIPLGVSEPTGAIERPIHVMTARGQRTALKKTDYVDEATLRMILRVLNDGIITEKVLRFILEHASLNGLGTDRSQGNGMFEYELTPRS